MKLNKLWLTSTKIAKRVEEEINILKSKFWINKNLEKTSNNPLKSIDKKWLKKLTLIFHHDKLQSKWLWELWNKITQNINELKQSWDKWDLEKLNLIYASIEKWDIQTLKKILNLTDEELVWLNKILSEQKYIPKLEQLPVEFKNINWVSDIKNPELIEEFKSGIYEPVSEIKNSRKIIESEIIESKITENVSKLDKILLNIERLKLSFASKWEKISELFSKTLLEAKNYILWLKKSIKTIKIPVIKWKSWEVQLIDWWKVKIWDKTLNVSKNGENYILKDNNNVIYVIYEWKVGNSIWWYTLKRGWDKLIFKKLLTKNEKLIKDFDKIPKSQHAEDLLSEYPRLKPIDTLEIDWNTFYFSNIISWKGGRDSVVWFIDIGWKIESRLFYKSVSDGWWRASSWERIRWWYSKWEDIKKIEINWTNVGYSYTTTTKVNDGIWKKLEKLNVIKSKDITPGDIMHAFLNLHTDKEIKNYNKYLHELEIEENKILQTLKEWSDEFEDAIYDIQTRLLKKYNLEGKEFWINMDAMKWKTHIFNDWWELDIFRETWKPGELKHDFEGNSINNIRSHFHDLKYENGFIPNFNSWPIRTDIVDHAKVWKTKIDIFEWEIKWVKVEWHMAQSIDDPNKIWISNIRLVDSKINSFWIDGTFINSWILTNKPYEYSRSLPTWIANKKETYTDITPILAELKPIREYKAYLASLNENKKVVNW